MKFAAPLPCRSSLSPAAPASRRPGGDEATFRIEFNDGVVTPQRLEVPANRRLVLELVNKGQSPAEFESRELRKEKVLAPGADIVAGDPRARSRRI